MERKLTKVERDRRVERLKNTVGYVAGDFEFRWAVEAYEDLDAADEELMGLRLERILRYDAVARNITADEEAERLRAALTRIKETTDDGQSRLLANLALAPIDDEPY